MSLPKIIKKVYVINLEDCKDRYKHIKKEFKKNNITNYEFFKATPKNDPIVSQYINNNFVKKFPPCFRCNANICNCSNNVLMNTQIAN